MDLTVEDDPDPADVARLEQLMAEETARRTGRVGDVESQLAIFVRDDDGSIVAGIYGWTWGGCAELHHLWVDESRRGHGLGTQLLDAAEAEAARRGCGQVVLFTHAVHTGKGGERYTRRGYELVGRVDDYPVGDAALWFRKPLPPAS